MATKRIPPKTNPTRMDTPSVAQPTRAQSPLLLTPLARYAAAADRLDEVGVMLHGLNRLHKNQHRVSTYWWPAFGQLRRHVRRLEEEVRPLKDLVKDGVEGKEQSEEEKRTIQRALWIREHFLPTAYLAFSRLVADRRFAQLGLLMMGILAQVHTALRWIIGDTATKKRRSATGTDNDEDDAEDQVEDEEGIEAETSDDPPNDFEDDLGEVIARVEDSEDKTTNTQPPPSSINREHTISAASTQPTKKRPRQEDDSDNDSGRRKSLKSLAKPSTKSGEAELLARSEKKRRLEEDPLVPTSKEIKETKDNAEKRDKKGKKEKKNKEKEKDKSKKTKKRKKNGDEFDDLFSSLL